MLASKWASDDVPHGRTDADIGGWDQRVVRYDLTRAPDPAELERAAAIVLELLRPATGAELIQGLTRLRFCVVVRDGEAIDLTAQLVVYAEKLQRYPGDIVLQVLDEWPLRYWPTTAELVAPIERRAAPRVALFDALRRGYQPPPAGPEHRPPSPEDIAAVEELLDRHFPHLPRHRRDRRSGHGADLAPIGADELRQVREETERMRREGRFAAPAGSIDQHETINEEVGA